MVNLSTLPQAVASGWTGHRGAQSQRLLPQLQEQHDGQHQQRPVL